MFVNILKAVRSGPFERFMDPYKTKLTSGDGTRSIAAGMWILVGMIIAYFVAIALDIALVAIIGNILWEHAVVPLIKIATPCDSPWPLVGLYIFLHLLRTF